MILRPVDSVVASYIKAQIGSGSVGSIKAGLQTLCELRRSHHIFRERDRAELEQQVIGVLYVKGRTDEKLRRWALNALARIGRPETAGEAITYAFENFSDDPQTAASAIAALFALRPDEAYGLLAKNYSFPEDLLMLSALQHAQHNVLAKSNTRVNIDKAAADVLKLALVAVGLNRAPEHVFDPKYENAQIVKDLGKHNDAIVSQYSVWAITENEMLGLKDLGIPPKDIESQPSNVRAWMHRLIAAEEKNRHKNLEFMRRGAEDKDVVVRSGLAAGLGGVFFDEMIPLVLDWVGNETDDDCRLQVLDHIVRQADQSPSYKEKALGVYRDDQTSERLRERMRAHASGHELFGDFTRFDANGSNLAFEFMKAGDTYVTKQNITFNGPVTGSAVSVGGDAINTVSDSSFNTEQIQNIRKALATGQKEIASADLPEAIKKSVLDALAEASAAPSPKTTGSLHGVLKGALAAVGGGAKAAGAIAGVINALHALHVIT